MAPEKKAGSRAGWLSVLALPVIVSLTMSLAGCDGGGGGSGQMGSGGSTVAAGGSGGAGDEGDAAHSGHCTALAAPAVPADGQMIWTACEDGIGTSTYSSSTPATWTFWSDGFKIHGSDMTAPASPECTLAVQGMDGLFAVNGVAALVMPCESSSHSYTVSSTSDASASSGYVSVISFDGTTLRGDAKFAISTGQAADGTQAESIFTVVFAATPGDP
jgi:hypothetical protein